MSNDQTVTDFQPVHSLPPEPSRPPWLLALGVVVLVAVSGVMLGVLMLSGRGAEPGASPTAVARTAAPTASPPATVSPVTTASPTPLATASPTPSPAASPSPAPSPADSPGTGSPPPTPTSRPVVTAPPQIAAQIDAVVAQVPPIRQLQPLRDVPYEFITRDQFQADLAELLEEEVDPELLAAEERLLKRLGLLPPETNLRELILELYGAQVAAFYEPAKRTFYIIERDEPFAAMDRIIVAHEYTHALQDQHFDLEGSRITDPSQGDAVLAQLAVVEGDATLVMSLWANENLSLTELFEVLSESLAPTDDETLEQMPQILQRQLMFPYAEGGNFIGQVHAAGGWAPVNEMLRTPPSTTEQILHPEKYGAREPAVVIDMPDESAALGSGWQRTYQQTMGELNVQIWAGGGEEPPEAPAGMPVDYPGSTEAAGWGGDRLHMYEGPDGAWAIVWELAWDSQADADEFRARALELQATLDGVSEIGVVPDVADRFADTIRILVAHDAETLSRLKDALGP